MKLADIELPSNRKFGIFFTAVFAFSGIYFFTGGSTRLAAVLFILALAFLIVTVAKAELLLPLNKLWMHLGLLIGMIVSPIVLGFIYFFLFTPIGLMMRLFGRDELRLKTVHGSSFWRTREPGALPAESFKLQF